MKDAIGDRMKSFYENRTKTSLPRRGYVVIRSDGKAFHTFVRGLQIPFDDGLMEDMDATAAYMCKNIMGAKFAFVQSDEISILLTDFDDINTQAWFDNDQQKMCSISAAMATRSFNEARLKRLGVEKMKWAEFDSRVFTIPSKIEVINYFQWRQQDTTKNSISSVAQSMYSHKELNGKNGDQKQEMIFQKGINWNDYAPRYKRGRLITKQYFNKVVEIKGDKKTALRSEWKAIDVPVFTQDRKFLSDLIPNNY